LGSRNRHRSRRRDALRFLRKIAVTQVIQSIACGTTAWSLARRAGLLFLTYKSRRRPKPLMRISAGLVAVTGCSDSPAGLLASIARRLTTPAAPVPLQRSWSRRPVPSLRSPIRLYRVGAVVLKLAAAVAGRAHRRWDADPKPGLRRRSGSVTRGPRVTDWVPLDEPRARRASPPAPPCSLRRSWPRVPAQLGLPPWCRPAHDRRRRAVRPDPAAARPSPWR
jgi:hypothetical protein